MLINSLGRGRLMAIIATGIDLAKNIFAGQVLQLVARFAPNHLGLERQHDAKLAEQAANAVDAEIGRASCRERV